MENQTILTREIVNFAGYFLGINIDQHAGQITWINNSVKLVNILRPGNQWGKTLILAVKHIYHAMTKLELRKFGIVGQNSEQWLKADYTTLNFGKTYEIAKSVHETIVALIKGEYALVDPKTGQMYLNNSRITSAIVKESLSDLPYILWWNGSQTLTRSTDDLGSSFKRRRLAYASADEVGDIQDIISVLNATVIPRIAFYQGKIDLIGTPQDAGEYQELIEDAIRQMEEKQELSEYYVQGGSMYENPGLSNDFVEKIERTADPDLRRRIIYGEFAETGDRYFTIEQIQNALNEQMEWDVKTGIIEAPVDGAYYVESVDYASTEDRTVIGVIRYDVSPARLVYLKFFKGKEMPIPMQYQYSKEVYWMYEPKSARIKVIFDGQALGGKIAEVNLKDVHAMPFPGKGIAPGEAKAQALGALKGMFDDGRQLKEIDGVTVDVNSNWGGIFLPFNCRPLKLELEGYKLKDDKIRNDFVMMLAQAAWYIYRRKPKEGFVRVRTVGQDSLSELDQNKDKNREEPRPIIGNKYQEQRFPRVRSIL